MHNTHFTGSKIFIEGAATHYLSCVGEFSGLPVLEGLMVTVSSYATFASFP